MEPGNAIEVKDLYKSFKVYLDKGTQLKERILFRKRRRYEDRKVLQGISFSVKKNEPLSPLNANVTIGLSDEIRIKKYEVEIPVKIKNNGTKPLKSQQPYPVHVSYHLYNKDGEMTVFDGNRTELDGILLPGEIQDCIVRIPKDQIRNACVAEIDVVQEQVFWFGDISKENICRVELLLI